MVEPPANDPAIDMLGALPEYVAGLYANIEKLVPPRDTLQDELAFWNLQYCRALGRHEEYLYYFGRQDVRPLWHIDTAANARASASLVTVPNEDGIWMGQVLMVRDLMDHLGPFWAGGPHCLGPSGPGPSGSGPNLASLVPHGSGPCGPPWVLMGQALIMGRTLMGQAPMGRALMAPLGSFCFCASLGLMVQSY